MLRRELNTSQTGLPSYEICPHYNQQRSLHQVDPSYALGSYWNIRAIVAPEGIYLVRQEEPELTPSFMIIRAAYADKQYTVDCKDPTGARDYKSNLESTRLKLKKKGKFPRLELVAFRSDFENPHLVKIFAAHKAKVEAFSKEDTDKILTALSRKSKPIEKDN